MNIIIPHGTSPPPLGPNPVRMKCPACNADIVTKVVSEANTKTHLIALLLCLIGCWCVCLIPYFKPSCNNQVHYCPNCETYIGVYRND